MKVLVACEVSGIVRDAFNALGYDAVSCDLQPTLSPGPHVTGDVSQLLHEAWDLIIAFPPCTDLAAVGASKWQEKQMDGRQQRAADFFRSFFDAPCERVAVENPVGWLNTNWRWPDQIIQPYQFGDPWRKKTCLWLKGLPRLHATDFVEPQGNWVAAQRRSRRGGGWRKDETANYGARDASARARTFPGIAAAMACQWGVLGS